jgi:hypothetical protein
MPGWRFELALEVLKALHAARDAPQRGLSLARLWPHRCAPIHCSWNRWWTCWWRIDWVARLDEGGAATDGPRLMLLVRPGKDQPFAAAGSHPAGAQPGRCGLQPARRTGPADASGLVGLTVALTAGCSPSTARRSSADGVAQHGAPARGCCLRGSRPTRSRWLRARRSPACWHSCQSQAPALVRRAAFRAANQVDCWSAASGRAKWKP